VIFITWYTKPIFRVRVLLSLSLVDPLHSGCFVDESRDVIFDESRPFYLWPYFDASPASLIDPPFPTFP
jgi:hypothetical protein